MFDMSGCDDDVQDKKQKSKGAKKPSELARLKVEAKSMGLPVTRLAFFGRAEEAEAAPIKQATRKDYLKYIQYAKMIKDELHGEYSISALTRRIKSIHPFGHFPPGVVEICSAYAEENCGWNEQRHTQDRLVYEETVAACLGIGNVRVENCAPLILEAKQKGIDLHKGYQHPVHQWLKIPARSEIKRDDAFRLRRKWTGEIHEGLCDWAYNQALEAAILIAMNRMDPPKGWIPQLAP